MAKKSKIANNEMKRKKMLQYAAKRAELKKIIQTSKSSEEEKDEAMFRLHSLPRNASPTRVRNRCILTGRPRAFYRKFGLSRIKFRELALEGKIPGVTKASW